jgi:peptide/nickel transport system ATP-binding protein
VSDVVLDISDLTIALPPGADRPHAVRDVNLQLRAGEVTCLIDESGSGKPLIARSILGLLPTPHVRIAGGRILFEGQNLATADPARLRAIRGARIAMIFQEPMTALNPLHTIGRQINEVLRIHTGLNRPDRKRRVVELPDSVHLPEPAGLLRFSASVVRRSAIEGDDRDGTGAEPQSADRRRTHHGVGCHHPGADPAPDPHAAAGTRDVGPVHHT